LAEALSGMLGSNDTRRRMGGEGRRRAEALFDEAVVIERQREVYERLFAARGLAWPEPPPA
jgi:glycosyltransferase involved in cell wall biosynthesis